MYSASSAINDTLSAAGGGGGGARWFQNLILAGSFRDFSPGWCAAGGGHTRRGLVDASGLGVCRRRCCAAARPAAGVGCTHAHTAHTARPARRRYERVGFSIFLVAVLSVLLPPAFALLFWLLRKARQRCLTRCVHAASQEAYNGAWVGNEFLLDYRWGRGLFANWQKK